MFIVITCSSLSPLANGQIVYSTNGTLTYGVMATYLCEEGFALSGETQVRTCGSNGFSPNGEWDGDAQTCEGESYPITVLIEITRYFASSYQMS